MIGVSLAIAATLLASPQLEGPESLGPEGMMGASGSGGPSSLGEVMKDEKFFEITNPAAVKTSRPTARNPFLLPQEQSAGRSLIELQEDEREAEKARQAAQAAMVASAPQTPAISIDHARALLDEHVQSLALTAVLISEEVQTAVIDGDLIDRGEILPGTAFVLSEIHRDGVRLSVGEHRFDLRLPPPGRTKRSSTDSDDSIDEGDSEQLEGQEGDESDDELFDTTQEG